MIGRILASATLASLILAGVSSTSYAQMSPSAPGAQQTAAVTSKPIHQKSVSKQVSMDKPTAKTVLKSDNIADQLNACALQAEGYRQSCMDRATRN